MANDGYLLHPELLESVPLGKSLTARLLNQSISGTFVDDAHDDPNVSVVVRAFNEAAELERLFEDIQKQLYNSEIEVIVVDNGSSDRSPEVAKYYGAAVVTLEQSNFNYPRSLNLGMEAASNNLVFVTVAHVRLSSTYHLHAGARHFSRNDDTAGAFGATLPNAGASYIERWHATIRRNRGLAMPAQPIKKCREGVLSTTGSMIAKSAWQELGRFDERYELGGEDLALARLMLKNGYGVIYEPALAHHHSHGLGLRDIVKEKEYYRKVRKPRQFDRQELLRLRPQSKANRSELDT